MPRRVSGVWCLVSGVWRLGLVAPAPTQSRSNPDPITRPPTTGPGLVPTVAGRLTQPQVPHTSAPSPVQAQARSSLSFFPHVVSVTIPAFPTASTRPSLLVPAARAHYIVPISRLHHAVCRSLHTPSCKKKVKKVMPCSLGNAPTLFPPTSLPPTHHRSVACRCCMSENTLM